MHRVGKEVKRVGVLDYLHLDLLLRRKSKIFLSAAIVGLCYSQLEAIPTTSFRQANL